MASEVLETGNRLKAKTDRMFELNEITKSDHGQVMAVYQTIRGDFEKAFNGYVTTSNALWKLLDLHEPQLLLPSDYLAGMIAVHTAALERDKAENQARPNLRLSGSVTFAQTGSVFGYQTVYESLRYMFNPDSLTYTAGLSYWRQLGNEAAEANIKSAGHTMTRRRLERQNTLRTLLEQYEDARIRLESAKRRVKITERSRDLAQSAFDRAERYQRDRRVTEYEVSEKLKELLANRLAHVNARTAVKVAEAMALASLGVLGERYGERTAQTDADRQRLRALAKGGMLDYFGVGR